MAWAHGWVLVERGFSRVRVNVSGAGLTHARLHAERRPDMAALSRHPSAPMAGWEAAVDVPYFEPGTRVTVSATATGAAGEVSLGSAEVPVIARSIRAADDPEWVKTLRARTMIPAFPSADGSAGLRILVFTHRLDLGGAQLYLHEMLRDLLQGADVTCTVLAPADGPLREQLEQWGAAVHITGPIPPDAARYESRIRELGLIARATDANAVLANTTYPFDGVDLASRLGLPAVWAIHESISVDRSVFGLGEEVDDHVVGRFSAALDSAAALVFEAEATRDLYRGHAPAHRLVCIDYGIPLANVDRFRREADRDRLRESHGFRDGDRVIACVGTFQPRKAQVSLALAFARVASEHPNALLVLVGDAQSKYSQGLRDVIARLGLPPDRIRIEPMTPDVYPWLAMADAFVLASDVESLPRSILEAMAFGLPVLATRAFGVPELIDDGVNGLLCDPVCFDSLTEGLRRLLSLERDELEELGRSGERTVRASRDSSLLGREYRELLEGLVADSRTPIASPTA